MFKYTNLKYWCLFSFAFYTALGPLFGGTLMWMSYKVNISIVVYTGMIIQTYFFPFISLLASTLAMLMVLCSAEKAWKKLAFTLFLLPVWFPALQLSWQWIQN
ncbi:MAG: hypothetical protein J6A23_00985 [Thermoguttaceae bacterium]|nr:hypothetical protein [Thermoguttaceae bacterium]MBP3693176.1 hypothetical protein [Thermoguttaceae bacterium]